MVLIGYRLSFSPVNSKPPNPSRLFFLPLEANTTSPFAVLSQHVSRKLSAQPMEAFWLDYRLLIDTSSLLPGALQNRKRRLTQILTLSQFPEKTYVLTEPEDSTIPTIISLPSAAAANSFFTMVVAKMQPLWAARNEFRVEKGTSVQLSDGEVVGVRVGELRVTVGQGVPKTRGVIIVLTMLEDEDDEVELAARETALRAALEATFRGSGVSIGNAKLVHKIISKQQDEPEHAETVRLYADLMRVAAPASQR